MKNKSKKMVMVAMSGVLIALLYHCAAVQQARDAAGMAGEMAQVGGRVVEATTPVVVDKYEPNDDLLHPTMIQMNSTTRATIEPAGDIDVFRVHVASNKREVVQVTFLNSTRNLAPGLYFYNQNREQIGESTGERGAAQVSGQFIAQPDQDCYIAVASGRPDDTDEERSGEYYSLEVKIASVSDEYEPNDALTEAAEISLGEIKGTINPVGDLDNYRVRIVKGGTVRVTFINPTLNLAPGFYLYNQNREQIGESTGERGAAQVSGQFIAQPNQYYYIAVASGRPDDIDEETSTEFYTLRVEMVE